MKVEMCRLLQHFQPWKTFGRMSSTGTSAFKNVVVESLGGIMTIAINRPEKRNCVNPETARELCSAFNQFEQDAESKVAILYGKGGTFCAGFDLSALASVDESSADDSFLREGGKAPMGPSWMRFSKPVIASVDGYAVAGGLELACMCDLRVVEDSAVMGVFCRRFGVPLIDGGTVRLQKLIGLSRAMDMILTGRSVSGKEAFEMGLANRLTATGTALGTSMQLAYSLLRYPQQCMNADRRSAYFAAYDARSTEEALEYEYENGIRVIRDESIAYDGKSTEEALEYEYENGIKVLREESSTGAKKFTSGIGKHGSFNLNKPAKPKL